MHHVLRLRPLLRVVGVVMALALLAGCGSTKPASPATPAQTAAPASKAPKESPLVAAQVAEGKLPKLEERLPAKPVVVTAPELGTYGGSWRMGMLGKTDTQLFTRTVGYENPVRWAPDFKSVEPGVFEHWEISPDARSYTFHLRKGLRWSDGQPVSADDVLFWGEDVLLEKAITPTIAGWLQPGGKPVKVVKVDDLTVRFEFAEPSGLFLQRLAHPSGDIIRPAHYLRKYHPKHNKAFVDEEVKKLGLRDTQALWAYVSSPWENPELPVLNAWVLKQALGTGQTMLFERNPYYWKVDKAGSQLPYLDKVIFTYHNDVNTMTIQALNGEIDWQERHVATPANKSLFVDNMAKGNFSLTKMTSEADNVVSLHLNLTHKDPEMRKIFGDKRFRVALSHAINRREIIDTVLLGQGEPWQIAPLPASPFYDAALAKQYTEFDVAKANQLLDEMGLTQKDSKGMRLRFDGKPLLIVYEVSTNSPNTTNMVDVVTMLKKHWAAVGVDVAVKAMDRTLVTTRKNANDHDAGIWVGGIGMDPTVHPLYHMPYTTDSMFAIPWTQWISSKGKSGEEPPAYVKRQAELHAEVERTPDRARQIALIKELLTISKEQFYTIGIATPSPGYAIRRNDFKNVPETIISSWNYPTPAPLHTSAFFTTRTDK